MEARRAIERSHLCVVSFSKSVFCTESEGGANSTIPSPAEALNFHRDKSNITITSTQILVYTANDSRLRSQLRRVGQYSAPTFTIQFLLLTSLATPSLAVFLAAPWK